MLIKIIMAMLLLTSCQKEKAPVPELSVGDAPVSRSATTSTMTFKVYLDKPSASEVSFDYNLQDGTAKAPDDYTTVSGTVTIQPDQTRTSINVSIPGNPVDLREPNLQFTVQLSKPVNCTLAGTSATGTIITENGIYLPTDNTGYTTPLSYAGYNLVWSDEFSEKVLDTDVWNQETGTGSNGWGNNELEYYTTSTKNTFLSDGNLVIEARKEDMGTTKYTSGRMTTLGKKEFTFGRIDIRAKLPVGKGLWPALWMMGVNVNEVGWPACGETDIMELIGVEPSTVYGTLHWGTPAGHQSKGSDYKLTAGDYSDEFHVFSIIWQQDSISWFVDNNLFFSFKASETGAYEYPFNAPQFFLFNVAVGGNWPGPPDNTTVFPERMFVDYVRVFQKNTGR
ncbi:MAG TPA: family 16 glycosylhydrolase [Bacteroidales bacterium]|nr:family 16 glycosylhydrolase [Bacteroidales bacterium]